MGIRLIEPTLYGLDHVLYMHHISSMTTAEVSSERQAMLQEIENNCMIARARLISRVATNLFDEAFRPFGLISSQHTLLGAIMRMGTVTRSEIGRANHIDRSTLTRNLKVMMDAGWIEEVPSEAHGRQRPLRLTQAGEDLLFASIPAWRAAQARAVEVFGQDGLSALKSIADPFLRG